MQTRRRGLAAGALASALTAVALLAVAEPLDPTLPQHFVVGSPRGPAPMDRYDHARTGQSKHRLPRRPRKLWRARVPGGIAHHVAVDGAGRVVVASGTHLSQLAPNGKVDFSRRLGASPAATGPVITSADARLVVSAEGEVISVDSGGKVNWRRVLPHAGTGRPRAPLPTRDGGSVVPVGHELFRLEPSGTVRAYARLREPVDCLLGHAAKLVIVTRSGDVVRWSPPASPSPAGSLGGSPIGGAVLASGRRLVAVVDSRRLVEFDLTTGLSSVRVPQTAVPLDGPPALLPSGATRMMSLDGLLLGHSVKGNQTLRVPLEPGEMKTAPSLGPRRPARAAPAVVVDSQGWVGYARPGQDIGVVSPDGRLRPADGVACVNPVSLVPAGSRKLVVACASGIVWMAGE